MRGPLGRHNFHLGLAMTRAGKRDPWLAGEPLQGVTFAHNTLVQITDGPHAGEEGWLVSLQLGADPIYTVELESGGGTSKCHNRCCAEARVTRVDLDQRW